VIAAKEAGAGCIIISGLSTPADKRRLALAKKFGADHIIEADKVDIVQEVKKITNGDMADLVIDCASGGPETIVSAIHLSRIQGRVIFGGRKFRPIPEFESDLMITKFLTVKGMRGHSFQSVEMAISIIASGKYPLEEMCTHVFKLNEVDQALHTVGGEGLPDAIHCAVDPWSS
jgi:threonine dehydrogenase-like Zn-dependent dehydrogenase